MSDFETDVELIEDLIEQAKYRLDLANCSCHLYKFWGDYCTTKVKFWIFSWTRHNHAAKATWARLTHKYREKSRQIKGYSSWLND